MKHWLVIASMTLATTFTRGDMAGTCQDKPASPITDICWSCLLPLTLGGTPVITMDQGGTSNPGGFLCTCTNPLHIGIETGSWEPARRMDMTRTPYYFVSLGGIKLNPGIRAPEDEIRLQQDNTKQFDYRVYWYADPILYRLEVALDNPCLETGSFDVAYITEVDPTWNDDELTMLLNPETFLFGNPIAQAVRISDCILSSAGFGSNALFRCAGYQGLVYPFNGHVQVHISHVQASSLLVQRVTVKLHREFLMWGTSGADDLCDIYPKPVMDKTQHKYRMLYPILQMEKINGCCCQPYGHTTVIWGAGKNYPYTDEDFAYMIFHKKSCCLGVGFW